jgi:DNA-directed RNA polymerase subunit L
LIYNNKNIYITYKSNGILIMMQSLLDAGVQKLMENAPKIVQEIMGGGGSKDKDDAEATAIVKPKVKRAKGPIAAAAANGASSSGEEAVELETAVNKPKKRVKKETDVSGAAGAAANAKSRSSKISVVTAAAAHGADESTKINHHAFARVIEPRPDGGALKFTLENADVSTANAIRRIILSEIPTLVFRTDARPDSTNQTTFHVNTTRHHNEILKQRLRCVPIGTPGNDVDISNYYCEIRKKNTTESTIYVTTEDFRVYKRDTKEEDKALTRLMFKPDALSNHYIDFARLLPKVADYTEGEELHVTAEFDMGIAEQDSAFNVCCTCAYGCTPDIEKQKQVWDELPDTSDVKKDGEKNWRLLSARRIVKERSFDFVIESVSASVHTNGALLRKACDIMKIKCETFISSIEDGVANIVEADVTMPYAFNIILRREGYTLGKALEHMIYTKHYASSGDMKLIFCAFNKAHPHDTDTYIQVALQDDVPNKVAAISSMAISAAKDIIAIFENIKEQFESEP